MNRLMTVAWIAACVGSVAGQDLIVCYEPRMVDPFGVITYSVTAQYFGPILGTGISQIWSDVSVRITSDGPITITDFNDSYVSLLGPPVIAGQGTTDLTFVAVAPGPIIGGVFDSSNPLSVFEFTAPFGAELPRIELVGQNTVLFSQPPFGNLENYQNADGSPGPLTFDVRFKFPAPGSAGLLAFAGVLATRRRR